jgi:hypothetical protein
MIITTATYLSVLEANRGLSLENQQSIKTTLDQEIHTGI